MTDKKYACIEGFNTSIYTSSPSNNFKILAYLQHNFHEGSKFIFNPRVGGR